MVKISRVWAMPSKHTFTIPPIAELIKRYVGDGKGWVDPFAGENSPAEWTNNLNPDKPTKYHVDAVEFASIVWPGLVGVLYDPPYSLRQLKECYDGIGRHITQDESQGTTFRQVKDLLTHNLSNGGLAISFGWNTIGFGKKRGFQLEEVLVVCHGRNHNDTLITVERKTAHQEQITFPESERSA